MQRLADIDELRPRGSDALGRGATLAVLAHLLLVGALSLGVRWRSNEPEGVEAELWAAVPQIAAPRAVEPQPVPTPPPPPPPPAPQQVQPPPPPPPDRDADIAREKREKEAKLERERAEQEKAEKERQQREAQAKKEAEQRAQEEAKKREQQREKEQLAKLEALRKENLKRMQGSLEGTGPANSTGTAAVTKGPSATYAGRIKARVKPNVVFTDDIPGNPVATVEVRTAPDGTIVGRRLVKSSGVPAWDEAALRAIDKTEVLPRDVDGTVPPSITMDFKRQDF
ncbi:MAG TPA: cell envelope integrity protein TolA [Burkholderiaceae bacterium]|jgi:colicin import membrane protein|nr:cell envelope integrity protein TolA [Burkholderiaceae bacterium]